MASGGNDTWHGMVGVLMIITFLSILGGVAYLLYGPGIRIEIPSILGWGAPTVSTPSNSSGQASSPQATSSANGNSADEQFLATQEGKLFTCDDGKALKAGFVDANVQIALSDGRIMTLPQTVTSTGEIRYANADGSFVFLNSGSTVSIEESGAITFANCLAPEE